MQIGGRASLRPGRRANMVPTPSTVTVQPAASQASRNQSRTRLSSSDKVRRRMPPLGVPPISAVSTNVPQRRSPSIVRLVNENSFGLAMEPAAC